MSRLYSTLGMLLIVSAICAAQITAVHSSMDKIFELTDTVIERNASHEDIKAASEKLYNEWGANKDMMCLFLWHDEVDELSALIGSIYQHCRNGNYELAYSDAEKLKVHAEAVDDTEIIKFENFF